MRVLPLLGAIAVGCGARTGLDAFVCSMAPPTPDCVCPCDPAWFDFFNSITISLARP